MTVAHYHCVVCSVTIARKTDMISHLKRHINKGETEASYSQNPDMMEEEPGRTHTHTHTHTHKPFSVNMNLCTHTYIHRRKH